MGRRACFHAANIDDSIHRSDSPRLLRQHLPKNKQKYSTGTGPSALQDCADHDGVWLGRELADGGVPMYLLPLSFQMEVVVGLEGGHNPVPISQLPVSQRYIWKLITKVAILIIAIGQIIIGAVNVLRRHQRGLLNVKFHVSGMGLPGFKRQD